VPGAQPTLPAGDVDDDELDDDYGPDDDDHDDADDHDDSRAFSVGPRDRRRGR
jgi:hypothetical protein